MPRDRYLGSHISLGRIGELCLFLKKISFQFALRLNGVLGSMRGSPAYVVWVVAMARGYCDGLTMGKQIDMMEMSESVNGISSTGASC